MVRPEVRFHRRVTWRMVVQLTRSWVFLCPDLFHRHTVAIHIPGLGIRRRERELSTACHAKFQVYPRVATCCTRSAPQTGLARLRSFVPPALSQRRLTLCEAATCSP
jgi:hypothetical protein